jgi:putative cell wall-binding protein
MVFVATGLGYADALAAAAVAGATGCPLLLTRRDDVPVVVVETLNRLNPQRIVVLGGAAAISGRVETQLAGFLPS